MSPDDISKKIAAFSHQEYNTQAFTDPKKIREKMLSGQDLFDRGDRQKLVPPPDDRILPRYVSQLTDCSCV